MSTMNLQTPGDKIVFSVVRMETAGAAPTGVGTAFVYSQEWKGQQAPFLVTSRRLVENAPRGKIFFTLKQDERPAIGEHVCLELNDFHQAWHGHPKPEVDVAVAPLGPIAFQLQQAGKNVFNTALDQSLLPPDSGVEAVEEVCVMGFAAELQDPKHLFPLVQRGTTAGPFAVDFNGTPKFLVQAPILAGMAGAPVLLVRRFSQPSPQGIAMGTQLMLLGMLSEVAVRRPQGPAGFVPIPPVPSSGMQDVAWLPFGLAVKASAITETVTDFLAKIETATPAEQTPACASASPEPNRREPPPVSDPVAPSPSP